MPPQLTRVLPLLGEGHLYLRWQVNNRGRRQLEGVGEAHLSPGGASRLHLLLLRRQTEHTDAQVRHMGHKTVDARDGWTSEAPEGAGRGRGRRRLTLKAATAALPSSLSSSSSSSLHSHSPSSVLCRRPLEPGTRRTCGEPPQQLSGDFSVTLPVSRNLVFSSKKCFIRRGHFALVSYCQMFAV